MASALFKRSEPLAVLEAPFLLSLVTLRTHPIQIVADCIEREKRFGRSISEDDEKRLKDDIYDKFMKSVTDWREDVKGQIRFQGYPGGTIVEDFMSRARCTSLLLGLIARGEESTFADSGEKRYLTCQFEAFGYGTCFTTGRGPNRDMTVEYDPRRFFTITVSVPMDMIFGNQEDFYGDLHSLCMGIDDSDTIGSSDQILPTREITGETTNCTKDKEVSKKKTTGDLIFFNAIPQWLSCDFPDIPGLTKRSIRDGAIEYYGTFRSLREMEECVGEKVFREKFNRAFLKRRDEDVEDFLRGRSGDLAGYYLIQTGKERAYNTKGKICTDDRKLQSVKGNLPVFLTDLAKWVVEAQRGNEIK